MQMAGRQPDSTENSAASTRQRLGLVDVVRGAAIAGVVHLNVIWYLEFTGFISGVAFHPIWLAFGRLLAGGRSCAADFDFFASFRSALAGMDRFCCQAATEQRFCSIVTLGGTDASWPCLCKAAAPGAARVPTPAH